MGIQDNFNIAWAHMKDDLEFIGECEVGNFDEDEQRFIIASAVDKDLNNLEKCELIGITYNHRPYRRYKANHDQGKHDQALFITARYLTPVTQTNGKPLTDIEIIENMINGDLRATDKLKAIELKTKLLDKASGSHTLKPWERLWCDVIIPNMVHTHGLQQQPT